MSDYIDHDRTEEQPNSKFQPLNYEDGSEEYRKISVEKKRAYYTSNTIMDFVKNAVSGKKYPFRLGSYETMRLYKVIDSTGLCDKDGFILLKEENRNPECNILFYDSPEQYFRHRKLNFHGDATRTEKWQNEVSTWYERNTRLFGNNSGPFNKVEYEKMVKEGLVL